MSTRRLSPDDAPRLRALASEFELELAPDTSLVAAGGTVTVGIGLLALLDVPELTALLARERALAEDRRFWKRWTRSGARDRHLDADARTADAPVLAGALEKLALAPRLFRAYVEANVALAVDHGALPADLIAGFLLLERRFEERGVTARLRTSIDTAAPARDDEPSIGERLRSLPLPASSTGDRALGLLAFDHATWFVEAMRAQLGTTVPLVPWAEIPAHVLAPSLRARGDGVAARLGSVVSAATFTTIHDALANGRVDEIALALEPRLASVTEERAVHIAEILVKALVPLLSAALLADGAKITGILGEESPRFVHRGNPVSPLLLVLAAMAEGPTAPGLAAWANALR